MNWDDLPIDDWMTIIRSGNDVAYDFIEIRKTCESAMPDPRWFQLEPESVDRDLSAIVEWATIKLAKTDRAGVYFGLDTLNMDNDPIAEPHMAAPSNIEIGWMPNHDLNSRSMEWVYDIERYGGNHLIESLRPMKHLYDTWPTDLCDLAD